MVGCCPYPFPAPLFIRPGTRDNRNVWDTVGSLYDNGAYSPQLSQLSEACDQFLFPTFAFVGGKWEVLEDKTWCEMFDPNIVMVKRALRSVVVAEICRYYDSKGTWSFSYFSLLRSMSLYASSFSFWSLKQMF